ncbi:MAG TPA: carboxypeptidase-like regulatory domain-containing protein [Bacteroidales bacterium]|nr:carboxypeptidase-like regulatory domain-containing protein [Bacteroidales bacterium]
MAKKIFILIIAFFAVITDSITQESTQQLFMLINGVVMDASTQNPISNVHFILNRNMGGATDPEGKFSLYMHISDTVIFSHIGYMNFRFVLSDTLAGNRFVAGIFMKTDTLSIGEVIVIPRMGDLKTEIMTGNNQESQEMINARNNLTLSTYQGLNSQSALGDPQTNYELLKRKQVIDAYEKGGIPSDKMVGLNMITVIPAAIYLLVNGLPQRPDPPKPHISSREMEMMKEIYRKNLEKKRDQVPYLPG